LEVLMQHLKMCFPITELYLQFESFLTYFLLN
jgi:hypothetical protein